MRLLVLLSVWKCESITFDFSHNTSTQNKNAPPFFSLFKKSGITFSTNRFWFGEFVCFLTSVWGSQVIFFTFNWVVQQLQMRHQIRHDNNKLPAPYCAKCEVGPPHRGRRGQSLHSKHKLCTYSTITLQFALISWIDLSFRITIYSSISRNAVTTHTS